jgi:hypothetical protein
MAKIIPQRIGWPDSSSPDVASYKVYYAVDTGENLTYESDFEDVGMPATMEFGGNTLRVIDLVEVFPELEETTYRFGVVAVDGRGNESSMREIVVAVDVTPPEPVPFVQEV